jgi:ribonuclease T2
METYWVSNDGTPESFWEHEWGKHGTCVSTLDPDCYTTYTTGLEVPDFFNRTVTLFKSLPTYDWLSAAGITPSSTTTYTLSKIQAALTQNHGARVYLGCDGNELNEVWYFFNVKGSLQTGTFIASATLTDSDCPTTGIQ